jgi:hypothetical protein
VALLGAGEGAVGRTRWIDLRPPLAGLWQQGGDASLEQGLGPSRRVPCLANRASFVLAIFEGLNRLDAE